MQPSVPIKPMLEKEGYPFKSKRHSKTLDIYQRLGRTESVVRYLGEATDKEPWSSSLSCPKSLRFQFDEGYTLRVSDKCCKRMKEEPLDKWAKENNKIYTINGIMRSEGGRRFNAECLAFMGDRLKAFQPLAPMTKEWEEWFIEKYNVELSKIYLSPYKLERTGCKGCPFARHLQEELDTLERYFPEERKQCEIIWKPVYEEYRRLNYRLKENRQMKLEDYV